MTHTRNQLLLEEKVGKLLFKLSAPAMVGMFVSSLYNVVDTIFIGQGVGVLGIAGVSIAFPIMMIVLAVALSLGIGGASVISRALGATDKDTAEKAMGNVFLLVTVFGVILSVLGFIFIEPLVRLFGANDEILYYASTYTKIILVGVPFFSFTVASNHLIRAEGNAKTAMLVMLLSAALNLVLDPIFIFGFGWGVAGAAWATVIAELVAFGYIISYFYSPKSWLRFKLDNLRLNFVIVKEVLAVGSSSFARGISMSVMAVIINHALNLYGGSVNIAAFGIINRLLAFTMMPLFGIIQGMQPIVGFNYGAKNYDRVKRAVHLAIQITTHLSLLAFAVLMIFPSPLIRLFTNDPELTATTVLALRIIVLFLPLVGFQSVVSGMYQSLGKAWPSLFLSLLRQVILLTPLVLILPIFFSLNGVWFAFPVADLLATIVSYFMYRRELRMLN